jgi:uncharacterized membrane protein YqjE
MDGSTDPSITLGGAMKQFAHRLMAIGENRFQLLAVEVQEERNRLLDMVFLAVAIAALGMLVAFAWSAALVIYLWRFNPATTLFLLGAGYALIAAFLCRRLMMIRRHRHALEATLEQLRKDHECLKQN